MNALIITAGIVVYSLVCAVVGWELHGMWSERSDDA